MSVWLPQGTDVSIRPPRVPTLAKGPHLSVYSKGEHLVLGKSIAHDMKSGAEGAHFFGALLLTFSFDKHREEGIPCKSGEVAWDSTAIRYIISNEKYIGDSVWQKYFSTDTLPYKCRLNRGQKVSYYAYGTHEGIVPKEDFEKANALMKSRAQKITLTKNSPYAFRKK